MTRHASKSFTDILELDGGIFDGLPRRVIPLEVFHLLEDEPAPPTQPAHPDSLAPAAMSSRRPPAPAAQRASLAFVAALAVGAGSAIAAALMLPAKHAPAPAQAAMVLAAPARAEAPRAPATAEPKPVAAPPAPQASCPAARAAKPAARAAADEPAIKMPNIPPAPRPAEVPISRPAAAVAIASAGLRARACKDADTGPVNVPVRVTFAPSGRATRATVDGGPLVGTSAGSCVARALRNASVPPFDGEPVTVVTTVHLR